MCGICSEISNEVDVFTDEDYDRIIQGIALGIITIYTLDYETYVKTAKTLASGVFKGYGKTLADYTYGSNDYQTIFELRQNVYYFSAAKTYQQTRDLQILLGKIGLDKAAFMKEAKQVLVDYNKVFLNTEYNTAIAQSQNAKKWQGFVNNSAAFPNLTYHTVGDQRVRFSHAALDGITLPVGHPLWRKIMPQNDWGCRCTVLQDIDGRRISDVEGLDVNEHVNPIFQFNPGIDKIVYSPKHPYFKVAPKDKDWARMNFGLPTQI